MQAGARCRRRPAFRPQAGEILAGQVIQDPLDDLSACCAQAGRRVFDACNHLDGAAAIRAGFDVDLENP